MTAAEVRVRPRWRLSRAKWMLLATLLFLVVLYIAVIRPYWRQMGIVLMVDEAQGEVTAEQRGPDWLRRDALGRRWMRGFDTIREISYGSDERGVTKRLLQKLATCESLQRLYVSCPEPCDEEFGRFACLPTLEVLSWWGALLTDEGMARITRCENLEVLMINDAPISDDGLHRLGELPKLERLVLMNCPNITGDGLVHFTRWPQLDDLVIQACPQVTDAGLAHLHQIHVLRKLTLEGRQFTDRAIPHMDANPKLEFIIFENTQVTAAGIAEFSAAHPGCVVWTDKGQVVPPIGGPVSQP